MKRIFCLLLILSLLLAGCGKEAPAPETTVTEEVTVIAPAQEAKAHYEAGLKHMDAQDYPAAIAAFSDAISLAPDHTQALLTRGNAYLASEESPETLDAAMADFRSAVDLDPALEEAWIGLADACLRAGDFSLPPRQRRKKAHRSLPATPSLPSWRR